MHFAMELAGYRASWRFRESGAFEAWLEGRPWSGSGDARAVRVAGPALVDEMARAIRRGVRGHDDGDTDVQVRIASPAAVLGGIQGVVCELLEVGDTLRGKELVEGAARLLGVWPTVCVLPAAQAGVPPKLLAEARLFVEQVRKLKGRATFVIVDTAATALNGRDGEAFDFTVGGPADAVLSDTDDKDAMLWRAYVHARLAWEAAGDPARALEWDDRGFRGLATGADDLLEHVLNTVSDEQWRKTPENVQMRAAEVLRAVVAGSPQVKQQAAVAELVRAGTFWRAPGETQIRPAPWLARAMLRAKACPEAGFYLRGCLVCAPLAREVLTRCFDLEARQRAIGYAKRGTFNPPPEAEERFRKFGERQPGSGAEYYPRDCPAAPSDGWGFTVFGEFISSLPLERSQLVMHHDLRGLRNALAHGHYISWAMLNKLREIERRMAG